MNPREQFKQETGLTTLPDYVEWLESKLSETNDKRFQAACAALTGLISAIGVESISNKDITMVLEVTDELLTQLNNK